MKQCRACKSDKMLMFLPLGVHPPANSFLRAEQLDEPEPSFELNTYACLNCGLVQIPDNIPPGFYRHYLYIPSASTTMHEHFYGLAEILKAQHLRAPKAMVVDVGCNDGLFLKASHDLGLNTLGIDPATNIVEFAREKGLRVVNEYFNPETARQVRDDFGAATVIVTTNTFNHIDDLHSFVKGVEILLADDGVFLIEVPHALDYVQKNEFDTIYHEHLSVFSVKSLVDLLRFFEMEIFEIERLPIHGGSMRVYSRKKRGSTEVSPTVAEWLLREEDAELCSSETYVAFAESVRRIKEELLALLRQLKQGGKKIIGYGAPAKGSTLLNYYEIGRDTLDYLVDKNPLKHGLYSPGTHIPIVEPERIAEDPPDYMLILAWNFADEIMAQQQAFRERGGKFILPIPEPRVVG